MLSADYRQVGSNSLQALFFLLNLYGADHRQSLSGAATACKRGYGKIYMGLWYNLYGADPRQVGQQQPTGCFMEYIMTIDGHYPSCQHILRGEHLGISLEPQGSFSVASILRTRSLKERGRNLSKLLPRDCETLNPRPYLTAAPW